jgi:diaminopropionate ammonia-lyase
MRRSERRADQINFPRAFHTRLPGAAPSPLLDLRPLADQLGLGGLLVKDETHRLGTTGFEVLGASWALYREVLGRLGRRPPRWETVEELRPALAPLGPLRVVTATDGDFGLAVARSAAWMGLHCVIYVPGTAAPARISALEGEGADVVAVGASWDDALAAAATETGDDVVMVSDSSWPGFEDVPTWVIEGYATLFEEVEDELEARRAAAITAVAVPLGVGTLAATAATFHRVDRFAEDLWLLGAEPASAACWSASAEAGARVTLPGPGVSVMEGLNRGLPSPSAWPAVSAGFDAFAAVEDDRAREAVRRLGEHGVRTGPTGAAGFAGILEALRARAEGDTSIPLGPTARVLVVVTEAAPG